MALVILAPEYKAKTIKVELSKQINMHIYLLTEVKDFDIVEYAIAWGQSKDAFIPFCNLKVIFSIGAGVDHIVMTYDLSTNVKIARIGDAGLADDMSSYVISAIGYWEHRLLQYRKQQDKSMWRPISRRSKPTVGIFGLGIIGTRVAKMLLGLGYKVKGHSQSKKSIEHVETFNGISQMDSFLLDLDCLVCLLPLTAATRGIINLELFRRINKEAFFINVARGAVLVEKDLILALEKDYLSEAFLDVFEKEPLPKSHPFWRHPKITITPHVAAVTDIGRASKQIAENIKRYQNGLPLEFEVDLNKGY